MTGSAPSAAIRRALLNGKRRPRTPGGSPTSRRGDGYEFVELREYVPGDDVRRIDWAATARSGGLQTRVILEDVALTLAGVLDDTPSMHVGRRRPLSVAAREALAAWYGVAGAEDRCVRVFGDTLVPHGPQRGAVSATAALRATGAFDLTRSLHVARTALRPGSALLLVTDAFDLPAKSEALLYVLARRCDCTLLLARDPWYDELPLSGVVRVRGAEGGAVRAYVGVRERQRFRAAVRARETALLSRFGAAGWRTGTFGEDDGGRALARAFGV